MTDRIVRDASAVVAMLLDAGPAGQWVADVLTGTDIFAPTLMPFECANVVRRQELSGAVSIDHAAQAHADLVDLSVDLWPYEVLADRVWGLRSGRHSAAGSISYLRIAVKNEESSLSCADIGCLY